MNIAVIDMGTNTFHLLVASIKAGYLTQLYKERIPVKIGSGGISEGYINDAAIERGLDACRLFKVKIQEIGVEHVFATATSAVRSAKNGKEFTQLVEEQTGISVRIISGDEEAESIYYGVGKALAIGEDPALIMDVGGGSIEFIIGNSNKILWKKSFEMGAQRLLDLFHQTDPMTLDDIDRLKDYTNQQLTPLYEAAKEYRPKTLIGSSGTFDTLSEIYRLSAGIEAPKRSREFPLSTAGFRQIYDQLITMNRDQRLKIPGMIEMRVDMIVVASILVKCIVEQLKIENIRVSAYALKEGILYSTIDRLEEKYLV